MKGAATLFRFLIDCAGRGERTALVTVTDVIGSSSRGRGTHMAVSETGAWFGSLSGGCVEAAVVGEAKRVIEEGRAELIRFGAGSRFIDIRLPCGGGLDLLIVPDPCMAVLAEIEACLAARTGVTLQIGLDGRMHTSATDQPGWTDGTFGARHEPDLRVCIIGHGAEAEALARLATAYGAQVVVLTPDKDLSRTVEQHGASAHVLQTPAASSAFVADPRTAVIMLFHDHDWEPMLLQQALASDAFYIGAMGSRKTQAQRLANLTAMGESADKLCRVKGPVGLIPATRDPETLALSVLSEIVSALGKSQDPGARAPKTPKAQTWFHEAPS